MFKSLYPNTRALSSYDIDYAGKYELGFRGVIFDIDNTLVEHGADANEKAIGLIRHLKELGYKVCFLSNNKEPRVKRFCDGLQLAGVNMYGVFHISKAGKPSTKNYEKAMEMMGTTQRTTLFVGDQLFTDVWGANRAGISSVLVNPIDKQEEIQIVLKRYLEKVVLKCYEKSRRKAIAGKAIVLIGFMGCGKSTIGKQLAEAFGYEFLDMDELIEKHEGTTISEIFATKGEAYFRNLETQAISGQLSDLRNKIISTGGGMPISPANHRPLKECGKVVYLKVSPETVLERLKHDTTRPLLQREDKEEAVRSLMAEREPIYTRLADVTIVTDGKSVEQVVEEVLVGV